MVLWQRCPCWYWFFDMKVITKDALIKFGPANGEFHRPTNFLCHILSMFFYLFRRGITKNLAFSQLKLGQTKESSKPCRMHKYTFVGLFMTIRISLLILTQKNLTVPFFWFSNVQLMVRISSVFWTSNFIYSAFVNIYL